MQMVRVLGAWLRKSALYLLGKHKPTYTPGVDMGDVVVVINASALQISNNAWMRRITTSIPIFPAV